MKTAVDDMLPEDYKYADEVKQALKEGQEINWNSGNITAEPNTFQQAAREVVEELMDTMFSKQRDYGKDNITDFGEYGVLVRANDKLARLKNLYDTPEGLVKNVSSDVVTSKRPQNESIEDSWKDLANYAILALMLRHGDFGLPLGGGDNE